MKRSRNNVEPAEKGPMAASQWQYIRWTAGMSYSTALIFRWDLRKRFFSPKFFLPLFRDNYDEGARTWIPPRIPELEYAII